jgi:hypothetical protein
MKRLSADVVVEMKSGEMESESNRDKNGKDGTEDGRS